MLDPTFFEVPPQYAPMSGLDEYMIHNNPFPVRVMYTSDPRAFERVWFNTFDDAGELLVIVGLGFYPNLGTADGFAIVNHRGRHTTIRGHRLLGDNRLDMSIGPLKLEVVKPFEEWRISLAENEYGISFDMRWLETKQTVFKDMGDIVVDSAMMRPSSGYESFGTQEGWVTVDGETHQISRDRFRGCRDHHWGVRDNVGGPSIVPGMLMHHVHTGEFVEFEDFALFSNRIFYNKGDARQLQMLRPRKREMHFDPDSKMLLGGTTELVFESGEVLTYTYERLGNQIGHLRCGMYGGCGGKGGTPEEDIWHGQYVADFALTGETYDTNDPVVQSKVCGLDDCVARFECNGEVSYGITETVNPAAYEAARAGTFGLSLAPS